jgi:hypothetical protein
MWKEETFVMHDELLFRLSTIRLGSAARQRGRHTPSKEFR